MKLSERIACCISDLSYVWMVVSCCWAIVRMVGSYQVSSRLELVLAYFFAFLLFPLTLLVGPVISAVKFDDPVPMLLAWGAPIVAIMIQKFAQGIWAASQ